jgi:hypothetical protein
MSEEEKAITQRPVGDIIGQHIVGAMVYSGEIILATSSQQLWRWEMGEQRWLVLDCPALEKSE